MSTIKVVVPNLAVTPSLLAKVYPWGSSVKNSEKECFAQRIAHYLALSGDRFRPLSFGEYAAHRGEFLRKRFKQKAAEKAARKPSNPTTRMLVSLQDLQDLTMHSDSPSNWVSSLEDADADIAETLWVIVRELLEGINADGSGEFSVVTIKQMMEKRTEIAKEAEVTPPPYSNAELWDDWSKLDAMRTIIMSEVDYFMELRGHLRTPEAAAAFSKSWEDVLTVGTPEWKEATEAVKAANAEKEAAAAEDSVKENKAISAAACALRILQSDGDIAAKLKDIEAEIEAFDAAGDAAKTAVAAIRAAVAAGIHRDGAEEAIDAALKAVEAAEAALKGAL